MTIRQFSGASLCVLALLGAAPALAQSGPSMSGPGELPADPGQNEQGREVIVTAPVQQSEKDVLQGVSVLTGEELQRDLRSTVAETLSRLPGMTTTAFGPNASRPILRGFQGDRIRVLTDGIGSIDVSNTSVDHPVVIDPLLADRIEVLRGPVALLYGTSAVGGVVNVFDKRIPRRMPTDGYDISAIAGYGSAAEERSIAAAADVAVGKQFVLHADGSYLKSSDLRIPGFALSPAARAAALSQVGLPQTDPEPIDFAANAAIRDRLPNTAAETWTAGVGASLITDTGTLGISYQHYDSLFGVPVRYATAVGQEQEAPRLDVAQDRVDVRAEVDTGGGFLRQIRFRAGHSDYRHFELEPDGAIGTAFFSKGTEARLELLQENKGGWSGASGAQFFNRAFAVEGDEAFLPRNETTQLGLFTLQQYDAGPIKLEGGLRYERTTQASKPEFGDDRYFLGKRNFDTLSGSIGASYGLSDDFRVGVNLSRTERAPSAEELFSNGNHAGTQAYELGNPNFRTERAWGLEATLHAHSDRFSLDASAYHNWFGNFIYETQVAQTVCDAAAGEEAELPCFQFQQRDARYWGFEVDASAKLAQFGSYGLNADVVADYVRASVSGGGAVPRIPPMRVRGGLELQGSAVTGRVEAEHVFEQTRIAAFETPTSDYTLVNASVAFRPFGADNRTTLLLSANNIFDVEARRHSSFLKDFAPLAGRDLRATLRIAL